RAAGVEPADSAYVEVGAGMQTTLQFADERDAYTLTDRATFMAHADRLGLEALIRGDSLLANDYAVMVVDPRRHPGADRERARVFADWLASEEARGIIRGLRRGGERLFDVPETGPAPQRSLTVSAAVSLKEALEEVVAGFEIAYPRTNVDLNLGASGALRRQIEAGAPVDVLISAAAGEVDALEERGAVAPGTSREVACNALVVIVPPGSGPPLRGLGDLRRVRRIAVGAPGTVPAGEYARQALESAGLRRELQDRLVFAENVRQALEYVARGETDAGFVYRTDALVHSGRVRLAFEVDARLHAPVAYVAAAVAATPRARQARRFLAWLSGAEAGAALRRHGFAPPPCAAAAA
ncbi:MAG: molybdate ABC transporter substrate-binding protein, partial [Gemmatimonadota bacterium]